jgi:hypothetical protein
MASPRRFVTNIPPDIPTYTPAEQRMLDVLRADPDMDKAMVVLKITRGTLRDKVNKVRAKYIDWLNLQAAKDFKGAPDVRARGIY